MTVLGTPNSPSSLSTVGGLEHMEYENLFLRRSQIRFSFLIRYKWRNSAWIPHP